MCKVMLQKTIKLEKICRPWKKFQNLINVGPLIRLWGLEKNPKLINVGPTFIPDYRVGGSKKPPKHPYVIYKCSLS